MKAGHRVLRQEAVQVLVMVVTIWVEVLPQQATWLPEAHQVYSPTGLAISIIQAVSVTCHVAELDVESVSFMQKL